MLKGATYELLPDNRFIASLKNIISGGCRGVFDIFWYYTLIHRRYYTVARTYEVYLWVEKKNFTSECSEKVKSFFHPKINFLCSNQRVIFFYYIDIHECFENKRTKWKQRKNKRNDRAISSLVRIWKISHLYPRCSFGWKIWVVYFSVKHSCLCNKWCLLLLEFLENLEFQNFLPGPWKTPLKTNNSLYYWKTPLKTNNSLYYWKTPEILKKHFCQFSKQTKIWRSIWLIIIVFFIFYVDSISAAATVAEIVWCCFVFACQDWERNWVWVLEKCILYPGEMLKNSWNFFIISQWAPC